MSFGVTKIAKALGISKGQASKLASRGMPLGSVEAASRWRAANLRPEWRKGYDRPVSPRDIDAEVTRKIRHDADHEPSPEEDDPTDNQNYWKAKARRETLLADLAEHELKRLRKSLVEIAAVRRGLAHASAMLNELVLAVPGRIAGRLVACSDAGEAQRLMRDELRTALANFTSEKTT